MTDPYPRGHDTGDAPPARVAKVRVTQAAPARPQALPTAFPPTPRPADDVTALPLVLDEKNREDGVVFTINDATFPDVPRIKVAHGSRQIFAIENKSDMDHPFHLHGFFFVQLSKDGVATPDDRLVLKDTVIVPKKSKTRLAATFDEPGRWMYHCHILEHAENGMMGEITVGDNPGGTGH
jgi:FtsP/CotA-like multicopper oxidase with cupredoxin domain